MQLTSVPYHLTPCELLCLRIGVISSWAAFFSHSSSLVALSVRFLHNKVVCYSRSCKSPCAFLFYRFHQRRCSISVLGCKCAPVVQPSAATPRETPSFLAICLLSEQPAKPWASCYLLFRSRNPLVITRQLVSVSINIFYAR